MWPGGDEQGTCRPLAAHPLQSPQEWKMGGGGGNTYGFFKYNSNYFHPKVGQGLFPLSENIHDCSPPKHPNSPLLLQRHWGPGLGSLLHPPDSLRGLDPALVTAGIRGKWGLSRASAPPPARSVPGGKVHPEWPSHSHPKRGAGGQPGLQGAVVSGQFGGVRQKCNFQRKKRKLRIPAIGGLAGGAVQGPPPASHPLSPRRTPTRHPPSAPRPRSTHRTPAHPRPALTLQPGQDPGPPSLRGPLSPRLVCGPGMRPGPAPPTGRQAHPHAVIGWIGWCRAPTGCRACPFLCGAPPPRPRIPAEPRGHPHPLLRLKAQPGCAHVGWGRQAGPLDPCLFPTEPSGCSLVGRGAPGRAPPDPQTPISSPGSPRAARAWAESAGQITPLDLPTPLAVPRAPTLPSLAGPASRGVPGSSEGQLPRGPPSVWSLEMQ